MNHGEVTTTTADIDRAWAAVTDVTALPQWTRSMSGKDSSRRSSSGLKRSRVKRSPHPPFTAAIRSGSAVGSGSTWPILRWPAERLFFEIYVHALFGRSWTDAFRASVVAAWTAPLEKLFIDLGFDPADARRRTSLALAAPVACCCS